MSFGPQPPNIPGDNQLSFSQVNNNSIFYGTTEFVGNVSANYIDVPSISSTTLSSIKVTSTAIIGGTLTSNQINTTYLTVGASGISSGGDFYSNGSSRLNIAGSGTLGFFGEFASRQGPLVSTAGYTQNTAVNPVYVNSTFKGNDNSGSAYTIDDIITALKNYGLLQS